jgi:cytoskeletal protein CcmA (bactofilin family)
MNTFQWRYRFLILVVAALLAFAIAAPAHAQGPTGGVIPSGTTIENDVALANPDIIVDGNVDGDLFVIGQNVTLNGNVTGSVFLVADRATLRGSVGGSVYAVAANLNLAPTARVEHSVYALALSLLTTQGSVIGRDLNTLAIGAQLTGGISRHTNAIIGPIEILRLLMAQAESLNLIRTSMLTAPQQIAMTTDSQTTAWSCLPQFAMAKSAAGGIIGSGLECLLNPSTAPLQQATNQNDTAANLSAWGLNRVRDFVTFAVIGLILIFALPRRLENWSAPIRAHPIATPGVGLLAGINGFLLSALLALVVIAVGIVFQALSLGALAVMTWTLGLALTAALFWLFILFLFFISQIVFVYWGARALLQRFAPNAKLHRALVLLLALLVFVLLTWIPLAGAVLSIAATLYGLGAIVLSWWEQFSRARKTPAPAADTIAAAA